MTAGMFTVQFEIGVEPGYIVNLMLRKPAVAVRPNDGEEVEVVIYPFGERRFERIEDAVEALKAARVIDPEI